MSVFALITGTLHANPEPRTGPSGKPYTRAAILHRDGETSAFVRVVAFGSLADELAALRRGDVLTVVGRAKLNAYLSKQGEPAAGLEVVVDRLLSLAAPPKRHTPPKHTAALTTRRDEPAPTGPLESWPNDL